MSKVQIKILLIEDDEEDYIITNDILSDIPGNKYQLDWASSFEEGLKAIEENSYDIFLIDYRLGKKEGLDIIRQISPLKKDTPFILLTGQGDQELDEKAMEAGAADFLTKGNLTMELLDRTIRYTVQHYKILSELKSQKEKAQTYLDMAGSIVIIVNSDETIQVVNKEGQNILGATEEEMIGKNWFEEFLPESERQQVRDVFYNLMHRKAKNVEHYENEIYGKDGKKHLIKWYNRLLLNDEGEPLATISSGVDITKQRGIEQKLNNYAIELEQQVKERTKKLEVSEEKLIEALKEEKDLSELKSRFVAMASHEFRTPLSAILSSAGLVARYEKLEQQGKREKHINRIKLSVKNLTAILNDFLSLEKLESNKVGYEPQPVDLDVFIPEFLEEINLLLKPRQSIKLHRNSANVVKTDAHLLRNVLNNLLSNAIKYSPEGAVVDLSLENANNTFTINVKDHGIGIPEEDQKNMFSRFFRAANAINIQGTGLGLTIVKRYLDLMDGTITFVSKPNQGTTFTVVIPQ